MIKEIDLDKDDIKKDFWSRLISLFKTEKNIFLISDTHFDHKNIIRFCRRPFRSRGHMNYALIKNWNNSIDKNDIVFFLGDMVYGRGSRHIDYWLRRLKGKIYFVNGNHEMKSRIVKFYYKLIIKYNNKKFLLVHDPKDIPSSWREWVICGHHHNNRIKDHPFINGRTKMINVGVELIGYSPLNINKLFDLDFEKIYFMKSINSRPIYNRFAN